MASTKVKTHVLAAGIKLFAESGYYGTTTRDLAKESGISEGSIYRVFESREKLFAVALSEVINRALDPAQLLLALFDEHSAKDLPSILAAILRRWYGSLEPEAALLLTQGYFAKAHLSQITVEPYAPIDKIIDILTTAMNRDQKAHPSKTNSKSAAAEIILPLLHLKITTPKSGGSKQEAETVECFINAWLQSLSPDS
jgi:AcrR family transcriptional regulator